MVMITQGQPGLYKPDSKNNNRKVYRTCKEKDSPEQDRVGPGPICSLLSSPILYSRLSDLC